MTWFRRRSLRSQLAVIGLAAVLIPVFALLGVVFATTSDEQLLDSGGRVEEVAESEDGVPATVVVSALVLGAGASVAVWWWAGRAVRPMRSIADVADEIQSGSLDRRLGLRDEAREVQALGDSFDRMLDRLERASATQRQLVEDTSHELRTPLSALAVNSEVILGQADPTVEDYRESAERADALIERLQRTVDELLLDARGRADSVAQVGNDLMEIVRRVVEQHRTLRPDVPVDVAGPTSLRLGIDGPSVERALVNLLDNAARHSPPDGRVEIVVLATDRPRLSVTDDGDGIDPDDLPRVFDRYYRGETDGTGIGLALVKQVAEAHGSIEVTSPPPDRSTGTRFTLTFGAGPGRDLVDRPQRTAD